MEVPRLLDRALSAAKNRHFHVWCFFFLVVFYALVVTVIVSLYGLRGVV